MWFDTWSDIGRVLIIGSASYVFLIVTLRLSGKRTLAQLNAFDLVVTVSLGSTLATIFLSSDVSFAEGAVALVTLVLLQIIVAFTSSRWRFMKRVTTAEPTVLVWRGEVDAAALKRMRIAHADVLQAVRQSGLGDMADVGAVVLESNGRISVIPDSQRGDGSSLSNAAGIGSHR